jgi:hypothetical protein
VGQNREEGLDATREMIKGEIKGNAGRLLGASAEEMLNMLKVAETLYTGMYLLLLFCSGSEVASSREVRCRGSPSGREEKEGTGEHEYH